MDLRADVETAAARIEGRVRETPLERSRILGNGGAGGVWLKLENLQLTGSFKLRGATNKLLSLDADQLRRGVVAASSGNHGAAVACAAAAVRCQAIIYVPESASGSKVDAIRSWGGEVRVHGDDCVLAEIEARRFSEQQGLAYLSPYNDPDVVAGQGTLGREIACQLHDELPEGETLDAIFVTLGGGGLISGVGGYLKTVWPELEVVACSPEKSPVMHASLEAGRVVELESEPTLSDGSAGGVEADSITFDICRNVIDRSILLTEEEIADALRFVIGRHHTLIEGAAATAVAAFRKERSRFSGDNVAIVLCGANIDVSLLKEVL